MRKILTLSGDSLTTKISGVVSNIKDDPNKSYLELELFDGLDIYIFKDANDPERINSKRIPRYSSVIIHKDSQINVVGLEVLYKTMNKNGPVKYRWVKPNYKVLEQ
ncbi:MAG: hypothetical protein ACP5N3_02465 [Candidatus Nanoarchaeia archaeon]